MMRFEKGLVPIRVEYFEALGDELLGLYIQRSGEERKQAGPKLFFREKTPKPD